MRVSGIAGLVGEEPAAELQVITRTLGVAENVGVRALLVYALHDNARSFYEHFGFEASPTDELHLMMLLKDARAAMPAY
jgi:N-acetylglutamate synthase-like GNAT family acetyltransferase